MIKNIFAPQLLYHNSNDTYDSMADGKDYRREDLKWEKIRSHLQKSKKDILIAFGAQKNTAPSAAIVNTFILFLYLFFYYYYYYYYYYILYIHSIYIQIFVCLI
jgi:hypothetical protein